jgi:hypothetical protein
MPDPRTPISDGHPARRDSRRDLQLRAARLELTVTATGPLKVTGCAQDGDPLVLPVPVPLRDRTDIPRAMSACLDEMRRRTRPAAPQLALFAPAPQDLAA